VEPTQPLPQAPGPRLKQLVQVPWPANGPDVTGGDVQGLGGHANNIPAELCYANSPVDPAYPGAADRGVLLFNATRCYPSANGPAPPANLRIVP